MLKYVEALQLTRRGQLDFFQPDIECGFHLWIDIASSGSSLFLECFLVGVHLGHKRFVFLLTIGKTNKKIK